MSDQWTIHKFGGSSLCSADQFEEVHRILQQRSDRKQAVVVSAMEGVTNQLFQVLDDACCADTSVEDRMQPIRDQQVQVIEQLFSGDRRQRLTQQIDRDIRNIQDVLRAIQLMKTSPSSARDLVSGYGELWSAQIFQSYLRKKNIDAEWLDARDVLVIEHGETGPLVQWEQTRKQLKNWLDEHPADHLVVTGYIASTPDGSPTTLGRNGSDYTAAIFASLLNAEQLHIWTDVDGVMTANPQKVPDARSLDEISYQEAMEMAYFGAKFIHPNTMSPAIEQEIPILIRNTFNPSFPGTRIHKRRPDNGRVVKGFATIDGMALVNLEGTGTIGVPDTADRLFSALNSAGVHVMMISQASSEHSVCIAVPEHQAETARNVLDQAFYAERDQDLIQTIDVTRDCSILACVGDGMAGTPGVAAKFFDSLGKANVNIRAIAQGSSERNISAVVDSKDSTRALRAAHSGFYLSNQTLSVGVIGTGNVGSTLLKQIREQQDRLRSDRMIDIRVRGIMNTQRMMLNEMEVDLENWEQQICENGRDRDMDEFIDHIQTDYHPHAVLIDCTANEHIARRYEDWMERGIHVITPNKQANSGPLDYYKRIHRQELRAHYLYETTVGAGLPVLKTLRDLCETGDRIIQIEGILSGTLSYLFNSFKGERPFSDILREAHDQGYTEPDPREDLSGMDVARKLVILAREMGLDLELEDLEVEGLIPEGLESGSVEEFFEKLPQADDHFAEILRDAQENEEILRFVGKVQRDGEASVRLRRYPQEHAFSRINLTDNVVEFSTRRYNENPLIVQGPGAGPEVTAGGVFSDLLRLADFVGEEE